MLHADINKLVLLLWSSFQMMIIVQGVGQVISLMRRNVGITVLHCRAVMLFVKLYRDLRG